MFPKLSYFRSKYVLRHFLVPYYCFIQKSQAKFGSESQFLDCGMKNACSTENQSSGTHKKIVFSVHLTVWVQKGSLVNPELMQIV